jgi:hypothetical protein
MDVARPRIVRTARTILALLALWVAPPAEAGRHYIEGQVVDRNGEPVTRAIITLAPGNVQLITDTEGRFLIDYLRDETGERTRLSKKSDYDLEVFKPGFHLEKRSFFYRSGPVNVDMITLKEDTITVEDDGQNVDPGLFSDRTHAAGATYEGQ